MPAGTTGSVAIKYTSTSWLTTKGLAVVDTGVGMGGPELWAFLGSILNWLQEQIALRRTIDQSAIRALQTAALQTNLYEAALHKGQARDAAKEDALVSLWSEAATMFYKVDPNLAERFELKAEYWTYPESWTPEQIHSAGISLQRITELARQLLREG